MYIISFIISLSLYIYIYTRPRRRRGLLPSGSRERGRLQLPLDDVAREARGDPQRGPRQRHLDTYNYMYDYNYNRHRLKHDDSNDNSDTTNL